MKKIVSSVLALIILLYACNNESKDSVEKADSANSANLDSGNTVNTVATDEESSSFLVQAANGGLAEVQMGQLAQQRAKDPKVKEFGSMMIHDHSGANDQVKTLAAQRNVTLPDSVNDEMKKKIADLSKKSGSDFDRAYINDMVNDHEKDVALFESYSSKVNDTEVKTFINNTLPKLRMHLDSVRILQKRLK